MAPSRSGGVMAFAAVTRDELAFEKYVLWRRDTRTHEY
jgi:hypothetical protein